MEDIKTGKALCLYWANLAANIPFFVHVDLRTDNRHCLVLWWFASTCRHFGMGGTHADPSVVLAQQSGMASYRRLAEFFKRGEFRGYGEEVHVHVLPRRQAFVVNLFNLSTEERRKTVEIDMKDLGLDVDRWYFVGAHGNWFDQRRGMLVVDRVMEPWSAQVFAIRAVPVPQ
jgi:hypothetical protein